MMISEVQTCWRPSTRTSFLKPAGTADAPVRARQQRGHRSGRDDAEHEHRPEGRAPAPDIADRRADRDADDAGNREAGEDQGDGHAALVFAHQADRHHHGDAEIGAVRDRDGDAQQKHRGEIGRERAGGLPEREGDGEADQQRLARQPRRGERQQRAAESDADGIAGDEIAGVGMVTPSPSATCGSTPAMTNSVVPKAKAAMNRATSGSGIGSFGVDRRKAASNHERPAAATEKLWPRL